MLQILKLFCALITWFIRSVLEAVRLLTTLRPEGIYRWCSGAVNCVMASIIDSNRVIVIVKRYRWLFKLIARRLCKLAVQLQDPGRTSAQWASCAIQSVWEDGLDLTEESTHFGQASWSYGKIKFSQAPALTIIGRVLSRSRTGTRKRSVESRQVRIV